MTQCIGQVKVGMRQIDLEVANDSIHARKV